MGQTTFWEPIGADWERLLNYADRSVYGSIRPVLDFGGRRWQARTNGMPQLMREFDTADDARAWVESEAGVALL